jgi:hypothetical protein
MRKWIGIAAFVLVLLLAGLGSLRKLYAQAGAGYTKLNTSPITTTSFTTGTLIDGATYNFEVTAFNSAGESTPMIATATVPATGTHTVTLSWVASVVDATHSAPTGYNAYDQQVLIPNPPGAISVTVN